MIWRGACNTNRFMKFLIWYPYMLVTALLVGKIATFSFLIAPIVHKTLEKDQAVKLLRVFFPRYYKFGIGCSIVGLILVPIILKVFPGTVVQPYWAILWLVVLLAEVFALKVLVPTVEANREGRANGDVEATKRWESAHRLSVQLNVLNLLLGLALLFLYLG